VQKCLGGHLHIFLLLLIWDLGTYDVVGKDVVGSLCDDRF
jgi:hypothetical protein